MTSQPRPLSDLTAEQLDAEACQAVGIGPDLWRYGWRRRRSTGRFTLENYASQEAATIGRQATVGLAGHRRLRFDVTPIETIYLQVSTAPEACAKLKQAALSVGVSEIVTWINHTGVHCRVYCQIGSDDSIVTEHDNEERAVALAVAAWGRYQDDCKPTEREPNEHTESKKG